MMNLKTYRWDASEYLETPEQMAAFEDGDSQVIKAVLGDIARAMTRVTTNLE